ncbi:MAG: carbohydrate ABC transporter permease [Oscillospiraceae bacterium]
MKKLSVVLTYMFLCLGALLIVFPILFSLALSFSDNAAILRGEYLPSSLHFENYLRAFSTSHLLQYMKNSFLVGVLCTVLQIVIALLAAYALVFLPFRGKKLVFGLFMATMMIPSEVLIICNFQTIRSWNLLNTYGGLLLPGLASTFGIFLFRQNMLQIPYELREAARVAGIGNFRFFRKIVIPMVKNTLVTLAIYFFLVSWNAYLWPLLSTTNDTVRTVQIGLRQLKNTEAASDYAMMAAGAMITSIPTLLFIFFGQKRLQEGMTKAALK